MLTKNAVFDIFNGKDVKNAIVQVIGITTVANNNSSAPRVRIVISDGAYYCSAVISNNIQQNVSDVKDHSIIKITDNVVNNIQGKRIVVILNFSVVDKNRNVIIGNPASLDEGTTPAKPTTNMQNTTTNRTMPQQTTQNTTQRPQQQTPAVVQQNTFQKRAPTAPIQRNLVPPTSSNNNETEISYQPISTLNPYQNVWTIKARVMNKTAMKTFNKGDKKGNLFTIDLIDEEKNEIRAIFYNNVATRYFDSIEEGKVYYFSKGRLKYANKQYSTIKCDFEITFEESTIITPVSGGEADNIPSNNFQFVNLNDLENIGSNQMIDVIGVVDDISETKMINTKKGETARRVVKMSCPQYGNSNGVTTVDVTAWDKKADELNHVQVGDLVAFKGVRKSSYQGISLSTASSTAIHLNPSNLAPEQYTELLQWSQSRDRGSEVQNVLTQKNAGTNSTNGTSSGKGLKPRDTISMIKEGNLGESEKGDFVSVKGIVTYVRTEGTTHYLACPNQNCKGKKVEKSADQEDSYHCTRCDATWSSDLISYRYVLSMMVQDISGCTWATAFDKEAKILMDNLEAREFVSTQQEDPAAFAAKIAEPLFKEYNLKLKVKNERQENSDNTRQKVQISSAYPIQYGSESKKLLRLIQMYQTNQF